MDAGDKRENPRRFPVRGFIISQKIKSLAVTYFHIDKVDTSIGAERFHFRVRKGIGWFPLAMAARQTSCDGGDSCLAPAANSDNLFRPLGFTSRNVAFKSVITPTGLARYCKSLGCYMVKPHGQLVLVS